MFAPIPLPYDYSALEPFFDTETMHLHYDKHHAGYVKNLNDVLANNPEFLNMNLNELLKNLNTVPKEIAQKVRNNAGGVANHNLFWQTMCAANLSKVPTGGDFYSGIISEFAGFDLFKEKFTNLGLSHFGSGWVWLVVNNGKKLEIIDTNNQDSPISLGKTPILALDVWEHAYYLKYKNVRADYIGAWWNLINWNEVEENFKKAGDIT
jgi:superoxide dismutase, Fe-Mn family